MHFYESDPYTIEGSNTKDLVKDNLVLPYFPFRILTTLYRSEEILEVRLND